MLENISKVNLVRIGSYITYSSLKKIGDGLLESFYGIIGEVDLSHHDSPMIDSIDAQLLTLILGEEYIGNTLGITDADLKIDDGDEFYNSIIGGKNPKNDVAVVSTKKLTPRRMDSDDEIDLFIDRTTKVALHEVGHNFGLTDHASFKPAPDGSLWNGSSSSRGSSSVTARARTSHGSSLSSAMRRIRPARVCCATRPTSP